MQNGSAGRTRKEKRPGRVYRILWRSKSSGTFQITPGIHSSDAQMMDADTGHQQQQHLLDPVAEVGQDVAMSVGPPSPPPAMTEEERQELQIELLKVEEEIQTLSQVLAAKERQLADIKRKLGVTPLNELKHNFTKTWQEVTTSSAYKRTSETLSHAGLKATAAFSNVGSVISRKLEDVRNAPSFKSFGEKVETWKTGLRSPSSGDVGGELESGAIPAMDPQQEDKPSEETPMH
ncbi:tumor protein D52 isoform X3 [Nerophis lumbriciformis]|uniref:tumor protein D52 isoform X3 n=1 Tax=Nerophis lumbriciformis TaxID=546530 RepID=UPI002ADF0B6D|nr:tumor protein D52-like isoform X3 [Nerophis lumbriciformis]